jgi:protein kinase C substrate 80K-H
MRRVLLLVLAVLLVLTGTCTAASERVSEGVANDDYCDEGGDEWLTSACAGVPGAPPFQCHGSGTGALLQSVPASRVRDGVCDCCDGEDEAGSPFLPPGHCPQLCHQRRLQLKAETLAAYKHISGE